MSVFSRLWRGVRRVAPVVGGIFGGPLGAAVGGALAPRAPMAVAPISATPLALPGGSPIRAIAGLAPAAGRAVGYGVARLGRAARSAAAYCRRHPAWCAGIGGLAAVEAMVQRGELPPVKRRRARGISGRELSAFRRVSRTLDRWCKVPQPRRRRAC